MKCARFNPDGSRIVTASEDMTARIWDAATAKPIATLSGHEGKLTSAHFSSDGRRIVTTSFYKTARVWDAGSGKLIATLLGHKGCATSAQFCPDGSRLATGSRDSTARVWTILPTDAGGPPDWFRSFLHYMAQMRLNSDGALEPLKCHEWLTLRERLRRVLRDSAGQHPAYLRILRRFVRE